MKHLKLLSLAFAVIMLFGCSSAHPTTPENGVSLVPREVKERGSNRWHWGAWVFAVDEDHTTINKVPIRETNLHYNVLNFVEGPPCPSCLQFGPIQPQGDGTFKIDITLRHPFIGQMEYTGFDVRGTVVFPATHYWHYNTFNIADPIEYKIYYLHVPLYFSHSSAGGAMVLNADGYSFYLFPGMKCGYDKPINKYQKGKWATDTEDLDGTVNPFIEFHSHEPRRMFLPQAQVTRTYHIKPAEGAFKFGYIVDASWALPDVTPVTNPAEDFPNYANSEDPVSVEFEQIAPLKNGGTGYEVTAWRLRHRKEHRIVRVKLISPELQLVDFPEVQCPVIIHCNSDPWFPGTPIDEYTEDTIQAVSHYHGGFTGNPPGKYLAIAFAETMKWPSDGYHHKSTYYISSFGYQIVELALVD